MSTQLIGFSIGGVARRFLVQPPSMSMVYFRSISVFLPILLIVWPNNLVTCALFNTLHAQTYAGVGNRGGLSRERFFLYAFLGSATWYLFPGYLFQALSYFSWVCWIAPDNIPVNQMFGYVHGLGMSLITFDWAQVRGSFVLREKVLSTIFRSHTLVHPLLLRGGRKPTSLLASCSSSVRLTLTPIG
jgi:hypothetical protein